MRGPILIAAIALATPAIAQSSATASAGVNATIGAAPGTPGSMTGSGLAGTTSRPGSAMSHVGATGTGATTGTPARSNASGGSTGIGATARTGARTTTTPPSTGRLTGAVPPTAGVGGTENGGTGAATAPGPH